MRQLQVVDSDGVEDGDAALLTSDEHGRGCDLAGDAADLAILLVQNSIVASSTEELYISKGFIIEGKLIK
jgi:hypothetical protein